MAMKVEVTVADIVRSFAKGVIGERIAVRKLEQLMDAARLQETRDTLATLDAVAAENGDELVLRKVIHTDNL